MTEYRLPPFRIEAVFDAKSLSESIDWGLSLYGIPDLWRQSQGEGEVVAVLDTGCDLKHEDLQGQIADAKDFSGSRTGPQDAQGHGTHVAGIIAAVAGNQKGVAGVAPKCRLLIGKVLGDNGSGSSRDIAKGIDWAIKRGATVINMSLGGPQADPFTEGALREAVRAGVMVIVAAGNDGRPNSVNWPGRSKDTIAVAAVDRNGRVANFSSRGPEVDIAAPGQDVTSCYPGHRYAKLSGTCIAAGEMVYTPNGPKNIEEIDVGDTVYAFKDGKLVQRVVHGVHFRGRSETHRLIAAGRDVRATASHEMLVFDSKAKELDWVRLGQLRQHHRLVLPRKFENNVNPYLDAVLDEGLLWLLGFFAGDGWVSETTRGVRTCFASSDKPILDARVQGLYQKYVGKPMKFAKNGRWAYDDSTVAAMMFSVLGINGTAKTKTFPLWLWNLPQHKQRAFYEGYRAADGSIYIHPEFQVAQDAFECCSFSMIRRAAILADYWGQKHTAIASRVRKNRAPNSKKESWSESHSLRISRNKLCGGWSEVRKLSKGTQAGIGIDFGQFATAAWRVDEKASETRDVYDLTVPDADCFVTHGIVTHNSMATPFVSGVVALVLAKHKRAGGQTPINSVSDLRLHLQKTAKDAGPVGHDPNYGWGLIHPESMLAAAGDVQPGSGLPYVDVLVNFPGSDARTARLYVELR